MTKKKTEEEISAIVKKVLSVEDDPIERRSIALLPKRQRKRINGDPEYNLAIKALNQCEKEFQSLLSLSQEKDILYRHKGFYMLFEPFIPEYCGFGEDEDLSNPDEFIKVYKKIKTLDSGSKEAWILFRNKDLWIIAHDENPIEIIIPNMLSGIITLEALGAPVSLEEVMNAEV